MEKANWMIQILSFNHLEMNGCFFSVNLSDLNITIRGLVAVFITKDPDVFLSNFSLNYHEQLFQWKLPLTK